MLGIEINTTYARTLRKLLTKFDNLHINEMPAMQHRRMTESRICALCIACKTSIQSDRIEMTCIDGGEKAVAVGEGIGANRNDGGTLTSNKLNRGPRSNMHPAAAMQSNIVSTPAWGCI